METWSIIAIATAPIALSAVIVFALSARELDHSWVRILRLGALAGTAASSLALWSTGAPAPITGLETLAALFALEAVAVAAATPLSLERLADEDPIGRFERQFGVYCRSRPRSANALQAAFSQRRHR